MADPLLDKLRLSLIPGVGPRLRQALLDHFGSPGEILLARGDQLRAVPGIGDKLAERIVTARDSDAAEREIELAAERNIHIIADDDPRYPRLLREVPDPPCVLFVYGDVIPQDAVAVAIVGSRHSTRYGLQQAERLGGSLARAGVTVISGLARGIDAAAHRGAMAAGGRTIAVLGSGLLRIYPPEHVKLADEVSGSGAVISELPLKFGAMSGTFPQRNRLISGMTLGTIVVEAALRSGALITARHAMEQGREVFAVPGRVDSRMSHGCHQLIRDGAKLVENVDDVLEELGPLVEPTADADGRTVRHPAELKLNEIERRVLESIDNEPTSIDGIQARLGLPISQVLATLSVLEMRRLIDRTSGTQVVRI